MWWFIGGAVVLVGGLSAIIARRGGTLDRSDLDGHGKGAAEAIHTRNNTGGGSAPG